MTLERLERYPKIVREIKQLEQLLYASIPEASDTVKSAAQFPYSQHNVVVSGIDVKLVEKWKTQLANQKKEKDKIEMFIEYVEDDEIRTILRWWLIENLEWQDVATAIGVEDKRTPKNKLKKYLISCT